MTSPGREHQRTIARTVEVTGIGLHSGRAVRVVLRPGRADEGVTFLRSDLPHRDRRPLRAHVDGVSEVDHATTLGSREGSVQTVEHLLAALYGLGIDSCRVEVDAPEVPILDGSSAPWVYLLHEAGVRPLPAPRRVRRILRPLRVEVDGAFIAVYPSDSLRLTCSIDFRHPVIGRQERSFDLNARTFSEQIAPARTFGFLQEVESLRRAGLVKGGSYENAIVLDEHGVLNGRLRFRDEFVRHKALDLVGDLALTGLPLLGHVVAHRAGHRVHAVFARRLLSASSCWCIDDGPALAAVPAGRASAGFYGLPAAQPLAHAE